MSETKFKEAKSQLAFSQALRDRLSRPLEEEMPPEEAGMTEEAPMEEEMMQPTTEAPVTTPEAPEEVVPEEAEESKEEKPSRVEEMLAKAIETITGLFKKSESKADATSKELKDVKSQMEKIISE